MANYVDETERWIEAPTPGEFAWPTMRKQISLHRRHIWGTGREMQSSGEGTRPASAKEEWEFLEISITRWGYKRSPNGAVWMCEIRQRLMGASGRHGRRNIVDRSREQEKKSTRRQVGGLAPNIWAIQEDLHRSKEENEKSKV